METQVYFSNVCLGDFVEGLDVVKSHLEQIAKENSKGVDLRRITVKGDSLNKKILGYAVIDYAVEDKNAIKTYKLLNESYTPISQLM